MLLPKERYSDSLSGRSATAIHSVPVDRTPNLPIERRTLYHWANSTTEQMVSLSRAFAVDGKIDTTHLNVNVII